jgi:aspartate/methionine/tyrosine aminotransferase
MQIAECKANYSLIVGMSEKLRKISKETGIEFLLLNRGVNSVCSIKLSDVVQQINFDSEAIQVYPPATGRTDLLNAINAEFFDGTTLTKNLFITPGGISGLDLSIQNIEVGKFYLPKYYWGAYANILKLRNKPYDFYDNFDWLSENSGKLNKSAVFICDPNNPLGDKANDESLYQTIEKLNNSNTIVIFDSPYRRVFKNQSDKLYQKLAMLDNVIITESFSKSIGLSGQRIGFVHCRNQEFQNSFKTRLLYATNGTNTFAQILVEKLLLTPEGKKAVSEFKNTTVEHLKRNIQYLADNGLLLNELYTEELPVGIFVVVNKSQDELLSHNIGSISLHYFTQKNQEDARKNARISVSVHHDKFVSYFKNAI